MAVTLLPAASQRLDEWRVLALSATVSNQLAAGASAVQASDLPVASVDAAARQLLFTLPTDDRRCWGDSPLLLVRLNQLERLQLVAGLHDLAGGGARGDLPGGESRRRDVAASTRHHGRVIGPNGADTEAQMLDDGSLCIYYLCAGSGHNEQH